MLLDAKLTPAQKEKVFHAVLPDFKSDDKWGAAGDRGWACNAMRALNDKRGIPYMLPLLNYPDENVKKRAKRALDSLGYK